MLLTTTEKMLIIEKKIMVVKVLLKSLPQYWKIYVYKRIMERLPNQ